MKGITGDGWGTQTPVVSSPSQPWLAAGQWHGHSHGVYRGQRHLLLPTVPRGLDVLLGADPRDHSPSLPRERFPCPCTYLGRIPGWIYSCQFACLTMKGICRGERCNWPGVGQNPPYGVFCGSLVDLSPAHRLWGVRAGPMSFEPLGKGLLPYRGRVSSSTFLAVSLAPRAGSDPRELQTPTRERQIKKALSVNRTQPSFSKAGEGRRRPRQKAEGNPLLARPRRCLVLHWVADGYGPVVLLKTRDLLVFSHWFWLCKGLWWWFCSTTPLPFMSFSRLPPPLPSQATTLMELWSHLTSTPASWRSTSARRTHQICKWFPCSTAGTVLVVVFCGEALQREES